MTFRATIFDQFKINSFEGICLELKQIEGEPQIGDRVEIGKLSGKCTGVSGIRTRSCLGGGPIPPQTSIIVELDTNDSLNFLAMRISGRSS